MIKRYGVLIILGLLIVTSGFLIYQKLHKKELPPYLIQAVGTIDGDIDIINSQYGGKVITITKDKGEAVKKGEIIAKLSTKELETELKALISEIEAKSLEYNFTKKKKKTDIDKTKLKIEIAKRKIEIIDSKIATLKEVLSQDKRDEIRIKKLVSKKLSQPHELEMAKLKTLKDKNSLKALKKEKISAILALKIANKELDLISSKYDLESMLKIIDSLKEKRNKLQIMLSKHIIKSPIDGYVDNKLANIGEVLAPTQPLITLINPDSYYLKIFIDELNNGKVKLGDKAVIFLDSYPNTPIPAKVTKIAKKAEFTPKEVAVKSDRITRVYEVQLTPIKRFDTLKLGLPATGVILIDDNKKLPSSLNQLPEM